MRKTFTPAVLLLLLLLSVVCDSQILAKDKSMKQASKIKDYSKYLFKVHTWKSGLNENNLRYIAADGSSSIVLEVIGGKLPQGIKLSINSNDSMDYGSVYISKNSITSKSDIYNASWKALDGSSTILEHNYIKYVAPDGLGDTKNNERTILFTITFPDNTKQIKSLKLVRTPVLFIHGKGSNPEAWAIMYEHFEKSNLYKSKNEIPFHFYAFDYSKLSEESFKDNTEKHRIVQRAITTVKTELIKRGVLAKKVDLVPHSMGGVLVRTYLQSELYNDDIRKVVTLSAPHSGAHSTNLAYSLHTSGEINQRVQALHKGGFNLNSVATENLRVNSPATRFYLNGEESLAKERKVPSFAIASALLSTKKIEDYTGDLAGTMLGYLTEWGTKSNEPPFVYQTSEEAFSALYEGKHDLIVSLKSQLGGLSPEHYKVFLDTWHNSLPTDTKVIDYLLQLLQSPSDDPRWCHTGWKPETLSVPPGVLTYQEVDVVEKTKPQESIQSKDGFVRFMPDKDEDNAVAGKEYTLNIEASPDVVRLEVLVFGDLYADMKNINNLQSPHSLKINIPESLMRDVHILAAGKTKDSTSVADVLVLHLENPKVKLESISLKFANVEEEMNDPEVLIDMNISDWQQFSVMGHFSDGSVREITDFPGIEFATVNNKIDITEPGIVFAKAEGIDTLKVTYQGKTAWKEFEITPYELDLIVFPENAGEVDESHNKLNEDGYELKTLTPNAKDGYTFSGWFMDGDFVSYDEKLELPMIRPYQVVAYFEPKTGAAKIKGFAFPNPVKDNVTFNFDVVTPGVYTFELYQELGEHLQTINKKYFSEGTHTIEFNTQSLAPGRYFCQILRQGVSLGEIAFVVTK